MNLKKLVPWNWFKNEEESSGSQVPVQRHHSMSQPKQLSGTMGQLQQEMDRLLDNFFFDFGLHSHRGGSLFPSTLTGDLLKPMVDIGASDKEYTITIEIPGVNREDIQLEMTNNTLTVRGEKKQKKEEKEKNYYRMECSYGAFQRVLALPDDAEQEKVTATFNNGVLTVTMPRKPLPNSAVKQISIQ